MFILFLINFLNCLLYLTEHSFAYNLYQKRFFIMKKDSNLNLINIIY
jgi:hypothetical protein